tara:strand:- start:2250 stop:3710 length:1461 start_codon:yes stop_codon:yes gene_type:complete
MSLKRKAASGSIWISLTRTGINVIDFAVYAYLARILSLEDFGLVGVCLLFVEFTNTIVTAGVNQNLVQRKAWSDAYASSTMIFVLGIAILLASILVFIGAPIAFYTYSNVAGYVVASLAPITILMSLQVVVSGKLQREFKNKQMGIAKFIATVTSSILIIALAEVGYGLWALVIGRLVNAILEFVFLSIVASFKPYLRFNKSDNQELVKFCLPLLWSAILNFVNRKVTNILTGIVLGPASFALLATAKKGEQVITQVTLSSINSMVVPSFSRVKEKEKLGDLYIKMVGITATLVLPIFMGLAAISEPFIKLAFGGKFSDSAVFMSISAFSMFAAVLGWYMPNLLISQAKTSEAFKLNVIVITCNFIVASLSIWFGITTMLVSVVLLNIMLIPVRFYFITKYIPINYRKLITTILPPYFCSLMMFFCISGLSAVLTPVINSEIVLLILLIFSGLIFYPLLVFTLFYRNSCQQIQDIREMITKKTNSV